MHEGVPVARCTLERLMRAPRARRVIRGKRSIWTTYTELGADCPTDLVAQQFDALAPNHPGWRASRT
jgi:hypothetical protein